MEAQVVILLKELVNRQPDELLSITEVAQILKINRNAVYELIGNGYIKALKLGSLKVRRSRLNAFMQKLEEQYATENEVFANENCIS